MNPLVLFVGDAGDLLKPILQGSTLTTRYHLLKLKQKDEFLWSINTMGSGAIIRERLYHKPLYGSIRQ